MKELRKIGNGGFKISSQGEGGSDGDRVVCFPRQYCLREVPRGNRLPYHQRQKTDTVRPLCHISISAVSV